MLVPLCVILKISIAGCLWCRLNVSTAGFYGCVRGVQITSGGPVGQDLKAGLFKGMTPGCRNQVRPVSQTLIKQPDAIDQFLPSLVLNVKSVSLSVGIVVASLPLLPLHRPLPLSVA